MFSVDFTACSRNLYNLLYITYNNNNIKHEEIIYIYILYCIILYLNTTMFGFTKY